MKPSRSSWLGSSETCVGSEVSNMGEVTCECTPGSFHAQCGCCVASGMRLGVGGGKGEQRQDDWMSEVVVGGWCVWKV